MIMRLLRTEYYSDCTTGLLIIDDKIFCHTLEDCYRDLKVSADKVYGETCILPGNYEVVLTLSKRFQKILPQLLNVKYFEGIRIHGGNKSADSFGCILVGANKTAPKIIQDSMSSALVDKLQLATGKHYIDVINGSRTIPQN